MSIRFVMTDRVARVEQKIAKRWMRGTGDKAVFEDNTQGWWAVFESCPASMFLGTTEPGLKAGDAVRLILEKV